MEMRICSPWLLHFPTKVESRLQIWAKIPASPTFLFALSFERWQKGILPVCFSCILISVPALVRPLDEPRMIDYFSLDHFVSNIDRWKCVASPHITYFRNRCNTCTTLKYTKMHIYTFHASFPIILPYTAKHHLLSDFRVS